MALLEREKHRTLLLERLALAERGQGQIVFLGGEAGTGKTSLIWQLADDVDQRASMLIGACDGLSTPQPLAPLIDIADALHGRTADLIWSGAPRAQLFHAVLDDLAARDGTQIVVFEDAHWADDATRDLVRFLGRRWRSLRALLILTFRCEETGPGHPLRSVLGELGGMDHVRRISIHALSRESVAELAEGRPVDVNELYGSTGGNPFFVTEVLAADEPGIPQSIRDAVMARASRLSPAARNALDAAAVLGTRFNRDLLMAMTDSDAVAIDACLDAGMLIDVSPEIGFKHELARQAMHDAIGPARRSILHARALSLLAGGEAGPASPDRLAYHAEEAGDRLAVRRYGLDAAERALALGGHRVAADQLARVLRFAYDRPDDERAVLLERYAHETYLIGSWREASRSREEAVLLWRSLGDRLKEGENERWLSRVYWNSGQRNLADTSLRKSIAILESLPPGHELAMALSLQVSFAMLGGHTEVAARLGERALAMAEAVGDEQSIIHILNSLGTNLLSQGNESGRPMLEESMRRARSSGNDEAVDRGWVNLACPAVHHFQFERAERYLAEGIAYAQDHDFESSQNYLLAWQAMMNLHKGAWTEADAIVSALSQFAADSPHEYIVALSVLGRLRARRGEEGARELLTQACECAAPADDICHINPAFAASAEAAWLAGDREQAYADASRLLPRALESGNPWWIGDAALTLWLSGETDLPVEHCAPPFRRQIEGDWLGAANAWEALGCPYQAALALTDGDAPALQRALETFESLGASPMVARTLERMQARGIRTDRRPRTIDAEIDERFGITPREREVLALLADGLSDRAIAESLYIGPGTVRTHLTNLFGKLDVKSRTAAIAAARRGGLL